MQAKKLALYALLAAMCAVLGYIALDFLTLKVTFESVPVLIGAYLFGPAAGALIGAIGTFIYQILRYGLSATTVLWMLPYAIIGIVAGIFAMRENYRMSAQKVLFVTLLCELIILVLNTGVMYLDSIIYGYYFSGFITGSLLMRFAICIGKGIVFGLVMPPLIKAVRKVV